MTKEQLLSEISMLREVIQELSAENEQLRTKIYNIEMYIKGYEENL